MAVPDVEGFKRFLKECGSFQSWLLLNNSRQKGKSALPDWIILFRIFNKCDDSVFGKCKSFALSYFGDA